MPVTVPRASRSCEHCPDGFDLHLQLPRSAPSVLISHKVLIKWFQKVKFCTENLKVSCIRNRGGNAIRQQKLLVCLDGQLMVACYENPTLHAQSDYAMAAFCWPLFGLPVCRFVGRFWVAGLLAAFWVAGLPVCPSAKSTLHFVSVHLKNKMVLNATRDASLTPDNFRWTRNKVES